MGLGAYDEDEHERRDQQNQIKQNEWENEATDYSGDTEFYYGGFGDDEVSEMLDDFKEKQEK